MVEDGGHFGYQPGGLILDSETLNGFSHDAIADSPVHVFRVGHDNENFAKMALRAGDFAYCMPGVAGTLKNQAMVSHAVGYNFVLEVIKTGCGLELEFPAIIQYQRMPAPGGVPFIFRVKIK